MNPELWPVHALVDGLYAGGVRRAVISPGSRNTPLVFALLEHGGMELVSHMDERSAGFFALGMARQTGEPVAVVCTSGTAVANLYPAVVEACFSRVPLVVLTADRPAELREVGANQTIRQPNLFGSHVKWACETPVPEDRVSVALDLRSLALRAGLVARSAPEGPVHVNVPLREPLLPPRRRESSGLFELPALEGQPAAEAPCAPSALARVEEALSRAKRPVIVAGPMRPGALAHAVAHFAARCGIPLLADILSQCRDAEASVPHYDLVLRADAAIEPPDLILRFGGEPTSKALSAWLRKSRAEVVLFDETPLYRDSGHQATQVVIGDPTPWLERLHVAAAGWADYLAAWRRVSDAAARVLSLPGALPWFEGDAVRTAVGALRPNDLLVLGNSRPVRDADALALPNAGVEVHANRGASGIDGVTSTALGHAVASGRPTLLVIGDVSFYHDLNGLVMARQLSSPFVVVLVHNGGGGIFRHLAQAERPDEIDWFTTPHELNFAPIVRAYGGEHLQAGDRDALLDGLRGGLERPGLTVVEVRFPNDESPRVYRQLMVHIARALGVEAR
ncbi:2-succinyl-5-enolpyruvyl-6-hydroxy-3-cyclohexene-1-carboxylic-acid synthase [Alicyclobacillus fructus]|uniref:2-succinyl-5-enolpyruvyl-6-hydroxy-3- cyclohexene-1-carboxylic-acid synthase n=1 Tax=Alicyclobacillus fructus TaxID=2816082 RepID=UPI001A90987C|nr:2-succinyl-5-enolpyruvyl-6-hydroxy-3-cyclohexene-1-carboxylic-acid synthase [Alicyclobacillus fructus]